MENKKNITKLEQSISERLEIIEKESAIRTSDGLGFMENYIDQCKCLFRIDNFDNLPLVKESMDKEIIESLNVFGDKSGIEEFNKETKFGTTIRKRIAIDIIGQLKSTSFRQTEAGKQIYAEYRLMVNTMNIEILEWKEIVLFNENTVKNTFLYVLAACDLESIENKLQLSDQFFRVLSTTEIAIPKTIDTTSSINEITATDVTNPDEISNEKIKNIVETNIKAVHNMKKWTLINKAIKLGKLVKCFEPTILVSTVVVGYGIYFGCNLYGNSLNDRSVNANTISNWSQPSTPEIASSDNSFASLVKNIFTLINDYWTK